MGPKNDCIAGAKMIIFKLSQQVPDFLDEEYKPDFKLAIARCRKAVDRLDTWEAYFSSAPAQELENSFLDLTDALNAWDVRMSGKQDINNRLTSFFMELGKEMRDLMEHISKLTAMVTFGAVVGSASVYFAKFITATLRALVSFPGYAISFLTGVLVGIGLTATAAYWVSLVVVVLVVAGTSCAVLMLVWQCVKMFVESFIGVAFRLSRIYLLLTFVLFAVK